MAKVNSVPNCYVTECRQNPELIVCIKKEVLGKEEYYAVGLGDHGDIYAHVYLTQEDMERVIVEFRTLYNYLTHLKKGSRGERLAAYEDFKVARAHELHAQYGYVHLELFQYECLAYLHIGDGADGLEVVLEMEDLKELIEDSETLLKVNKRARTLLTSHQSHQSKKTQYAKWSQEVEYALNTQRSAEYIQNNQHNPLWVHWTQKLRGSIHLQNNKAWARYFESIYSQTEDIIGNPRVQ